MLSSKDIRGHTILHNISCISPNLEIIIFIAI